MTTLPGRFDLPLLGLEVKQKVLSEPIAITFQDTATGSRATLTLHGAVRLERPVRRH